jgi:hypothetical protein
MQGGYNLPPSSAPPPPHSSFPSLQQGSNQAFSLHCIKATRVPARIETLRKCYYSYVFLLRVTYAYVRI